ncbi:hypothetical protein D3C81_1753520 [compost metagenome]
MARLCCTGWLENSACHSTDSRPYQAAPATSSIGSCQKSVTSPPRWSTPIMVYTAVISVAEAMAP